LQETHVITKLKNVSALMGLIRSQFVFVKHPVLSEGSTNSDKSAIMLWFAFLSSN